LGPGFHTGAFTVAFGHGHPLVYVEAAVEALRKKERQDETQFTIKINGFLSFKPPLNVNVLFFQEKGKTG